MISQSQRQMSWIRREVNVFLKHNKDHRLLEKKGESTQGQRDEGPP